MSFQLFTNFFSLILAHILRYFFYIFIYKVIVHSNELSFIFLEYYLQVASQLC